MRPPFSDPAGVDPEEAFVASLSSCHMLWFLFLAAQAKHLVDSYQDLAVGTLGKNAKGQTAFTKVTLTYFCFFGVLAPWRFMSLSSSVVQ